MPELFTAADLRALADAVERLSGTTQTTGVVISGWGHGEIRLKDVVIQLQWRKDDDAPDVRTYQGPEPAARGEYVIEFPDPS
ncbi:MULTISPECIES: hypothetical protein [unclassified Streptomyces]|uniref:hypothetical protein n=1 Tax=unclassified Streptomyces TaxID=2593676 RepID=UPI001488027E|nr:MULTISPECIES: hypothetical protein [unclassified Streptomyces]